MKHNDVFIGCLCILTSFIIDQSNTCEPILCVLQYGSLVMGIVMVTYGIIKQYVKRQHELLYYLGVIILLFYFIILFDTYIVHAIPWFPGILRYAMFSTYGIAYLFFIFVGYCLCHKE